MPANCAVRSGIESRRPPQVAIFLSLRSDYPLAPSFFSLCALLLLADLKLHSILLSLPGAKSFFLKFRSTDPTEVWHISLSCCLRHHITKASGTRSNGPSQNHYTTSPCVIRARPRSLLKRRHSLGRRKTVLPLPQYSFLSSVSASLCFLTSGKGSQCCERDNQCCKRQVLNPLRIEPIRL